MPARAFNFVYELNADFQRVLYLKAGPDAMIAGFTGLMQIRPSADSETVITELTTSDNSMQLINGAVVLNLPADTVIDTGPCTRSGTVYERAPDGELPFKGAGPIAVYDVQVISPAGVVTRILSGDIVFAQSVSRGD